MFLLHFSKRKLLNAYKKQQYEMVIFILEMGESARRLLFYPENIIIVRVKLCVLIVYVIF